MALIGEGGMGQVYRATDTRLKRQVAIKTLPPSLSADQDRLARFQREAEVLASLNHPNIAAVHGFEESGGVSALVMELVDGDDLSLRIARGAIPLEEALPIARQIAEALEAAHEKGIIHRDLKPANIKLRADATVKVLDFGLAKALEPAGAPSGSATMSPTINTPAMTQAGMILGTAAYMSPEQAKGRAIDRRADVWAFGAVLFEMVSGRQPFSGDTVSETLAEVMKSEPPWQAIPVTVPAHLVRLIRQCLVKEPRQRIRDMGDVRLALDGTFESATPVTTLSPDVPWTRLAAMRLAAAAAVVASIGVGGAVWMMARPAPAPTAAIARLAMTLPDDQRVGGLGLDQLALAVSPRGTLVAYVAVMSGREQLYVRAIDAVESKALAGTEQATNPFFSPDGQWIGFFSQGKLKKVSVAAGTIQTLSDAPNARGGSWAGDVIYFAATNSGGISKVSADGGVPTEVTTLDRAKGEISHRWPQVLPGAQALLLDVWTGPGADEKQVHVLRLDTGKRTVVVQAAASGRYVASGHVIYARNDELFSVPFDVDGLRVSGQASRLRDTAWKGSEGNQFAVSDNGVFVSVSGSASRYERRLVWVGRDGRVEPLAAPPREYYGNAVISPDGTRAAVDMEGGTVSVWLYDFVRATLTPLTTGKGSSQAPRWTADGTRLVYRGTRTGTRNLWWKGVDDAAGEERLSSGDGIQTPGSWSADGQWLAYNDSDPVTGFDIWALPSGGDRKPRAVAGTPSMEASPRLSPDGRWLAYTSDESGRTEVLVQSFPEPGGRTQISTRGGTEPVWSHDGRELFYLNGDAMMAVEIRSSPAFAAGTPRMLFEGRYVRSPNSVASYDVSADGQRFLRVQPMHPDPPTNQIQVTLNWFEELKRIVRREFP
ncbi:MAG TPA: protein kinase [Gemmatimonadales bacterium]|nr:protein kinase [Gemmatimonadales bacterium]